MMSTKHVAGLVLGGLMTAAVAAEPAMAQVIAPTNSTLARWLDLNTGEEFVLGARRNQIQIGGFPQPRRIRLCVTSGTTPASLNLGARMVADDGQVVVVPVGRCREIQGERITVTPAGPLGGNRRVKGMYSIVG